MTTKKNLALSRSNEPVDGHEYAIRMEVSTENIKRKDPFSPAKNAPTVKRKDTGSEGKEGMNAALEAIKQLTDKVDTLGTQLQQNSIMLTSIAKAVEFNAAEIKDCKTHLQSTIQEVAALKKDNTELMERVLEMERYKCRWNLRIRGLKEKEGEDVREAVAQLLVKISPSWSSNINHIVDSVHRIGRREENKTRHDIIQFTQRIHRDALWRMTKDHAICKELRISFIEDLCKANRETRAVLWPKIKEARDAGKRAYFRGGAGYINGQRIT
ncbi:cytoplasmic dynein 2 heavy chain 1-like protein [Labeo rohita]|uniref:Cytoplasmic dynein 2 heavy chain 1-like protein n=1 Tax=Labeo rohita TaxID=84645 RepID=A0A498NLZ5_LABRO|nr:cytoplasmic dynein 2 heavy chain 1-like protein [Labeo rohita]RXN33731.1 cytoplasmic dynein 2 heavy chain 1-like protein [Labeo rohita]